jgi:starch phosphorylase
VFVPDYRVSLAEQIIPGADLSEQISTAGTEASGTGNMKLAMNGALTIGTLDGANIELRDAVGAENMFIFGLTRDDIQRLSAGGLYRARDLSARFPHVERIFAAFGSNLLCPDEPGLLGWISESMLDGVDAYFHVADLPAYIDQQHRVSKEFAQPGAWAAKAILNVARIGPFSCDRTVAEYARDIWQISSVKG